MILIVWIVSIPIEQKANLNRIKNVGENTEFCNVIMSSEDINILEFNQYKKSDKAPFIIYVNVECVIGNIDRCKNDP